jgi:hypothetical protein
MVVDGLPRKKKRKNQATKTARGSRCHIRLRKRMKRTM